jgi:hypothetical protein
MGLLEQPLPEPMLLDNLNAQGKVVQQVINKREWLISQKNSVQQLKLAGECSIRKIQCQLNQLNLDLITPYLTYNKN